MLLSHLRYHKSITKSGIVNALFGELEMWNTFVIKLSVKLFSQKKEFKIFK